MNKRILVAGGAGFLGSHLIDKLIDSNSQLTCIDNLSTGSLENIKHLSNNKDFNFIEQDIINSFDQDIDEIYNLACPASPIHYQADPIQTTKTCVIGSLNLLDLCAKNKAKILQASTSEVYGDPEVHPQVETYWGRVNPVGIRSCYDEGKRCAETLFFDYHRTKSTHIKVIRIFNTYGPRMDPNDGRVVSNFIIQALLGNEITVYGEGQQTRSFCYVDDLVDGITKMMCSPDKLLGPINLGNPNEFTILELAENILRLTKSKSKLIHMPLPSDDPTQRKPDISQANDDLLWEPKVQLEDGLKETINYFSTKLGI
jgi:UDP-glucuronate decarboxylase